MSDDSRPVASPAGSVEEPIKREKPVIPEGMSKREYKRQLKQQKMAADRETFLEQRREKRKMLREKRKRERAELPENERPSRRPRVEPKPTGMKMVVDCGFDDLMKEGERTSLARQIIRCYSENRRAPLAVDLTVSSFNGQLQSWFETHLHSQHLVWKDITFTDGDFTPNENTIYLSSDSDHTLEELDETKTYVIGGIVDKVRYKDLCKDKAEKMGLKTARLPIGEHIRLSGRRVLATNHVFELMLKWLEVRDWKLAFEAVLPSRKQLPPKKDQSTEPETTSGDSDEH